MLRTKGSEPDVSYLGIDVMADPKLLGFECPWTNARLHTLKPAGKELAYRDARMRNRDTSVVLGLRSR